MTIREKSEKEGMELDAVINLAVSAGIDVDDIDRTLSKQEAIKLGKAVNSADQDDEPKSSVVKFWSTNRNHIIDGRIIGGEAVRIVDFCLVLDAELDRKIIEKIRRYPATDIFEVMDVPFDPDGNEYFEFHRLLDDILFTGHHNEPAKAGVKCVRAIFSDEELLSMHGNGFDPIRLRDKALRSKSVVRLINNI